MKSKDPTLKDRLKKLVREIQALDESFRFQIEN
jgi:hypothetical protein